MKFCVLLVLAAVSLSSSAEKAKQGRRSSVFNLPANAKIRAEDVEQFLRLQNDYDDVDLEPVGGELRQAAAIDAPSAAVPAEALRPDSSNGRLFLKKFMLFSGLLGGNQNTQPIIPIIITGTGTTGGTTQTVTTTGTISGTGTITTTPIGRNDGKQQFDDYLIGEEDVIDDQIVYGKGNANRQQQNNIKLKQGKGNQPGVGFVVPQKYLRYFQNNPNALAVNPTIYNNGGKKYRNVHLNNNGNIKRKRARTPTVHRFVPQQ